MKENYNPNRLLKLLKGANKICLASFLICGALPQAAFSQQQTYTFTTAGATGANGPTQTQVNLAYSATNLNNMVTINTQGIQEWTVPITGAYQIEAYGAQGGASWGLGAKMSGTMNLTGGTVLKIVVGQAGGSQDNSHGSGGGGSFVVDNNGNTPLVIAGGGGGRGAWSNFVQTESNGTTGTAGQSPPSSGAPGGVNGGGGAAASGNNGGTATTAGEGSGGSTWASGGGGLLTDGGPYNQTFFFPPTYLDMGGYAFVNGAMGGDPSGQFDGDSPGGFGGGGGCGDRGAGGGGYSGGGGGTDDFDGGGGGGSFNATSSQTNVAGFQSGDGIVLITALCNFSLTSTSAGGLNVPICSGSSATLSTDAISNYSWDNGTTNATLVVSPTITTTYTLQAMSQQNCTTSNTITVVVDNTPTVTAASSSTAVCAGKPLILTGSGATSYTWTNGASTVPNATSFTPVATSDYTVTGGNACGTATAALSVTVNPLPNVGGSANNPTVCTGGSVILNGTGSASGYTWTGGITNNTSFVPNITKNYTVTGASALGCINKAVVGVTVVITPSVAPVVTPTAICLNDIATLSAVGAIGYTWTAPPASAFSNANSVTVSPTSSTTYTLSRLNGACPSTMTVSLVVNGLPNLIMQAPSSSVVCASSPATLSAVGAITYLWYPGGFSGSSITVYPFTSTNYTVVAANANCTIAATTSISTIPNPTITIVSLPAVICAGSTATLTANGASTYTWQSPVNQAQQTVTVSPLIPALYTVEGTGANGCISQQNQVVLVNAAPNLTTSILNPGNYICAGGVGTLVATGTGPTNYSWSNGGTASSTTVNPTSTTVYTVTGTNPNTNCQSVVTATLAVYISTFVVASPTAICKGQTATLTASGAAASYTWNTNVSAPSITVNPLVGSTYYVTGITGNCSTTQSVGVAVNSIPPVTASALKGTICRFEPGLLTASGATSYSWSNSATTNSISVTPTVTTTYTVTGTDNNGCSKTVEVTLFINACLGIAEVNGNTGDVLSIYPNPNNGNFTIKAETAMNVRIVNETGQLVKRMSLTDNYSEVNISNLANGIYFILVEKDGNVTTKKMVVNK